MDKNNTNNNQNYDLTSGYTADDEEAPIPSRTTLIWNRVLKITLLVDLVLILIVGSYCLYKYIGGDEIVPPAADLEYNPQPFNKELAKEVLDYQDPNPLMSAIVTDQPLTEIQKILDSGIDVNAQDATGNTALHYAIFRENRKLIKLLLNHGSNRRIKNHKEQSCTDVSFQISPRKIGFIIIAPEDYDDNGIITRTALIKDSVKAPIPLYIITIPLYIMILNGALSLRSILNINYLKSYIIPKTTGELLLELFNVIFIVLSLIIITYSITIFTLEYPFQYLSANILRDLKSLGGLTLAVIGLRLAIIIFGKLFTD